MATLRDIQIKIHADLNTLQEQAAEYGGDPPLKLRNQIQAYKDAIALTEQAIQENLSETDWKQALQSFILADDILELLHRFIPDLPLHEQQYRERIKKRYAQEAAYYIPLAGETTQVTPRQTHAHIKALRSAHRRRSRAKAEYDEWIQAGQEIKRIKLKTLREGVNKYPCIVLLGDPGSGKTTALENLAYQFADEPDIMPLPLRLSEFGPEMDLEAFITQGWGDSVEAGHWGASELAANLAGYLAEGKLLILFDALNEMPREGYKERAVALRRFIDQWKPKGNQFLVTCRVLDYGEELSGLQRVEIQLLSDDQIQQFLRNELPKDWEALWQTLVEGGDEQHRLLEMARNPYLLTLMIDIYVEDGELGQNRAELMTRFTQILMSWAKEKCPPAEWLDADVQREALSILAFEMQDRAGSGAVVDTGKIKTVMPETVQPDPYWPPRPSPPDQVLTLAASANIVEMPVDRSSVRFYHQLLQEYFAAYQMLQRDLVSLKEYWHWPWLETEMPLWVRPEDNYDPLPPPPPTGWEETTILAAGLAPENDDLLIQTLLQINPVLAGRCLIESRAKVDKSIRQRVIDALLKTIAWSEVALRVRIAAGEVLGYLGDPRLGEMVTVPAGKFLMGDNNGGHNEEPQHRLFLPDYRIGKYPLTNAEYSQFIEAGGYRERRWWTETGWQWRSHRGEGPNAWHDARFNKPNQPVVAVSWFECVAYCRWLSGESGQTYRLPTEAEWEKAARGMEGRVYPWGKTFEASRLNALELEGEQQVRTTTPVGIYANGVSLIGAFDCAGNVSEWCATEAGRDWFNPKYKPYPYDVEENEWQPDYLEGTNFRVQRGGSYLDNRDHARCAYRSWEDPVIGDLDNHGCRLVSPI